jgi:cytochrome P450
MKKQLAKGWYAMFNVKQTHYNDPSTFQEDGSHMDHFKGFQPERWLNESTRPTEWVPFGDGRRRCIGERLGMTKVKIFLAILARKVSRFDLVNKFDDNKNIEWQSNTVMARPAGGTECTLVPASLGS